MNANICIHCCSKFIWWGAWLNENKTKTIFAPEYFLGFKVNKEFLTNMIPKVWNKISI
tara:strand:+ start:2514 stop:2687 length:174 start_codon:yes stop_codon:yes gene_type:complete